MHDMTIQNERQNPTTEGKTYHIAGMARVGVTNMASYMRGVTTLHHYERISSRDLGLKELRIFGTEMVLAFPGGFPVGMVRPLYFQEFDRLVASLAPVSSRIAMGAHDKTDLLGGQSLRS